MPSLQPKMSQVRSLKRSMNATAGAAEREERSDDAESGDSGSSSDDESSPAESQAESSPG